MAGQVWLVVALCSIIGIVPSLALTDAQIVYNPDGSIRLERINVPGQTQHGRMSWQTPDLSQVWIQYPVNQHGRVPWTPAQFTYSVVSDPVQRGVVPVVPTFQNVQSNPQTFTSDLVQRVVPVAPISQNVQSNPQKFTFVTDNQEPLSRSDRKFETQVPTLVQSLPNENEYEYDYEYIDEALPDNQFTTELTEEEITGPVMNKFPGPDAEDVVLPEMNTFPVQVTDEFSLPEMNKFQGPGMNKFPGPVTDEFSQPEFDERVLPEMDKFSGPNEEEFPDTTIGTSAITTTEPPNQTTTERNRFTLPFTTTTSRYVQFTEARITPSPTRFRPTIQSRPMMNKFRRPVESRVTPIPTRYRPTTERTVMNKFSGPTTVMNEFPGPEESRVTPTTEKIITENSVDVETPEEEVISATEPVFEFDFNNELNNNIVESNDQVEDTTELGPIIRFTSRGRPRVVNSSRGRPRVVNRPAQKTRFETRKQSVTEKPIQSLRQDQSRRPVPQLIVDPSLRESISRVNTGRPFRFRRPGTINQQRRQENNPLDQTQLNAETSPTLSDAATRVDNENGIRQRRPLLRRPGIRARPGIRRRPVGNNNIIVPSTGITLPRDTAIRSLAEEGDENSGRGAARSPPRYRFRNVRPQ